MSRYLLKNRPLLTAFFAVAGFAVACNGQEPQRAVLPAYNLSTVDQAFRDAVHRRPSLHGAWLEVEYNEDPTFNTPGLFTIHRIVDASRAAQQRAELLGLIQRWIPGGNYKLHPVDGVYPFSRLIADLETEIETDPKLMGCQLLDAWYDEDPNQPGSLLLRLQGRTFDGKQDDAAAIAALCGHVMRRNPVWLKRGQQSAPNAEPTLRFTPDSQHLELISPVESYGRHAYAAGVRHFGNRDFARAEAAFRQAAIESPRKLQYYYWWILTDLAQGKPDLARRRMEMLVERFEEDDFDHQSAEYRYVVRSLERVQGPLRQSLLRLEARALYGQPRLRERKLLANN